MGAVAEPELLARIIELEKKVAALEAREVAPDQKTLVRLVLDTNDHVCSMAHTWPLREATAKLDLMELIAFASGK